MVTKGDVARSMASAAKTICWVVHRLEPLPFIVDERDDSNAFARGLARGPHQAARTHMACVSGCERRVTASTYLSIDLSVY